MKLLIFIKHDKVHFCTEISTPDIVCNILDGKHPPSLTSDKLIHSLPLPVEWHEQRTMLGFS